MQRDKVIIIIPTYNEGLVIEETLHDVFKTTSNISEHDIHILVFDSNSKDATQQIVRDLQSIYPQLHLQTEPHKSGLGSAYLQAMRYALDVLAADVVIEFDADLSHQPKYIRPILATLQDSDVVVGSRYIAKGEIPREWGWHRKLLSILGNYVARFTLTPKYKDFTSGFRATRREALIKALPQQFLSNHYAYKLQLLWSLHKTKATIVEYPIVFVDRQKGQSKLPANSIFDSLRVILLLRFYEFPRYFKMCFVGLSGMVIQFALYNVLRQSLSPFNALQIAVLAAIINNFILNHRVTFKDMHLIDLSHKVKAFGLFIVYSLLMILIQSYWLKLGVSYLGEGYITENLLVVMGALLGSILNYFIYSRLIWRAK